jgi:transcriptional regulator with XRE-family HTH domain
LGAERGRQSRLATAIGVSSGYLSDVANGKKTGSIRLYLAISDATGIPINDLMGSEITPEDFPPKPSRPDAKNGFAEPAVVPFKAKNEVMQKTLSDLAPLLAPGARHLMFYLAQRDYAMFSIQRGDILLIGTPQNPSDNELVVVNFADAAFDFTITALRQRVRDIIVPPITGMIENETRLLPGVLGVVLATLRAPLA